MTTDASPKKTATADRSASDVKTKDTPPPRVRGFSSPSQPNFRKLIKIGTVRRTPDPNSPTGMKDMAREGDIMIEFTNGFWQGGLSDDDDVRIAWCEVQAALPNAPIMDIMDPQCKVWTALKKGQQMTARKDPTVAPGINVSAAMRGEASLEGNDADDPVDSLRKTLEGANAAGG